MEFIEEKIKGKVKGIAYVSVSILVSTSVKVAYI